jgi:uncharacterized DUF497 family protein
MVTKSHTLAEIVRTAEQNGGVPLGRDRFSAQTGIKETDWLGKSWVVGYAAQGRLLVVCYVERGGAVRLVSARRATPRERKRHEG